MGKKSRRRPQKADRETAGKARAATSAEKGDPKWELDEFFLHLPEHVEAFEKNLLPLIREAEKRGAGVDEIFEHQHIITPPDPAGVFRVASAFSFRTKGSLVTPSFLLINRILCNGGLQCSQFLPMPLDHICDGYFFRMTIEDGSYDKFLALGLGKYTHYAACKAIISDCLLRMEQTNGVFATKFERIASRLYGLETETKFTLPKPLPAPTARSLWDVAQRKEYISLDWCQALKAIYGDDSLNRKHYNTEVLEQALMALGREECHRKKFHAMLRFMASWHTATDEPEIASWLLWELGALEGHRPAHEEGLSEKASSACHFSRSFFCQALVNVSLARFGVCKIGEVVCWLKPPANSDIETHFSNHRDGGDSSHIDSESNAERDEGPLRCVFCGSLPNWRRSYGPALGANASSTVVPNTS